MPKPRPKLKWFVASIDRRMLMSYAQQGKCKSCQHKTNTYQYKRPDHDPFRGRFCSYACFEHYHVRTNLRDFAFTRPHVPW